MTTHLPGAHHCKVYTCAPLDSSLSDLPASYCIRLYDTVVISHYVEPLVMGRSLGVLNVTTLDFLSLISVKYSSKSNLHSSVLLRLPYMTSRSLLRLTENSRKCVKINY